MKIQKQLGKKMLLLTLRLHNFRNFKEEFIRFHPKLNLIYGENAQGKTNLLEAIYLLSTGRSFRTSNYSDLIRHDEKFFFLEAEIIKDLVSQTIKIYYDGNTKKITHNTQTLPNFTSLLGLMPSTVHAPQDVELITGPPAIRRRFLNLHLAQSDPLYVHHLGRFFKALKERNFLLKKNILSNISIYEAELAKSAVYITQKRAKLIAHLKEPFEHLLPQLTGQKEPFYLRYVPSLNFDEENPKMYLKYKNTLEKMRSKDLQFRTTQVGPHRDDFIFYLDQKIAKSFASEGQKRTLASALRLAEYSLLSLRIGSPAILNIDDLGAHLDAKRENLFHSLLKNFNQVFITAQKVSPFFEQESEISAINIKKGKILI